MGRPAQKRLVRKRDLELALSDPLKPIQTLKLTLNSTLLPQLLPRMHLHVGGIRF